MCSTNGHHYFRRACGGISVAVLWRSWFSSLVAFRYRVRTAASRCSVGGVGDAMPARIGSWLTGVVRRQLETIRKAVLNVMSSFLVWLLHQTGEQYLAVEKTNAWVEVRRVLVKAPQVVPDK